MTPISRPSNRGFTLIELLTVIAIIGILAAIIIPTTGAVRNSAKKAQTKSQFSQWSQAALLYKQEYGFFPPLNRLVYGTARTNKLSSAAFAAALTGREIDGTAFPATADTADLFGNKKRNAFYSIAESDLNAAKDTIVDAFGNSDIVVIYDKNSDGMITDDDLDSGTTIPTVLSAVTNAQRTPDPKTPIGNDTGPRTSIVFYSAGKGGDNSDIVYSWE